MRRNRRVKRHSRFVTSSVGIASLIISAFIMVMIFFAMNSRCAAITRNLGEKEKELKRLEAELAREKSQWDGMKVPENLNKRLVQFGLEMIVPREDQIVRMGRTGVPVPGQLALVRRRGGSGVGVVAHMQPQRRSVTSTSSTRRRARNGVRK